VSLIELQSVTRAYKRGGEEIRALDEFSLEIPEGGFYALMGPSGSGKTTLLNMLGGLDLPDAGTLRIAGQDLSELSGSDRAQWRADTVGFVFQGFNLLPVLTAQQNVELPLLLTPLSKAERRQHALHALKLVGLEDRASHRPRELSGGQEQRVAIARALATDPQLILADEPTGDLDRVTADSVLDLLVRLNAEFGKTIVMVTHDPLAADHARHVVHLDKGKLGKVVENPPRPGSEAAEASPAEPDVEPGPGAPAEAAPAS
jgi:putative ABC transport system ATP-binding protein